jgi:hypothetical protein
MRFRGRGAFAGERCSGYPRRGRVWISDERHCFAPFSRRIGRPTSCERESVHRRIGIRLGNQRRRIKRS